MSTLYRKYRPHHFDDLKGQDHVREVLQNALKSDRVSHAYLFTGPRGTGKTSTARILARALNCEADLEKVPCNTCNLCQEALNDSLTDLIEIDAASHGLVDDARDLVEKARFMPSRAKNKIYIIDEVHMLSKSAFNALLKIIEEPPEHVYFILATTESHKVLETIRSRCQRFDFHLADEELLKSVLATVCTTEKVKPSDDALDLLADHARGSFRDGLSLLEQVIGMGDFSSEQVRDTLGLSAEGSVHAFVDTVFNQDLQTALKMIKEVHDQGHDLSEFCQDVLVRLRELLLMSTSDTCSRILLYIDVFLKAHEQLKSPVISEMPLELAVYACIPQENAPAVPIQKAMVKEKVSKDEEPVKEMKEAFNKKDDIRSEKSQQNKSVMGVTPPEADTVSSKAGQGGFDKKQYLSAIKQASLRSLLKFSDLEYKDQTLLIKTRSGFEKDKLMSQDTHAYLIEVLRELVDPKATVEVSEGASPLPEGIKTSDLESVF